MKHDYFIPMVVSVVTLILLGAGCNNALKLKEEGSVKVGTEETTESPTSSLSEEQAEASAKIEV